MPALVLVNGVEDAEADQLTVPPRLSLTVTLPSRPLTLAEPAGAPVSVALAWTLTLNVPRGSDDVAAVSPGEADARITVPAVKVAAAKAPIAYNVLFMARVSVGSALGVPMGAERMLTHTV